VEALEREGIHQLIAVDSASVPAPAHSGTKWLEGDIADPALIGEIFATPCNALVHLATVPGGAAEENRALAQRVNIDATLALLDAARANPSPPRVIFASSIAVYGDLTDEPTTDETPLAPRMIYGAQKAMAETWIATLSRRGEIQGLSLRLPGIVARPRASSGMKSAFMSNLFHAARAGESFNSPVSPEATMWLMSRPLIVQNMLHALSLDAQQLPDSRAVTLPSLRISMGDLVAAVAHATGCATDFVNYAPDTALEAGFGRQPEHRFTRAAKLGFSDDGSIGQLVTNALSCT
jgi:nucleoside-diphosphate-sugar epimerase